MTQREMIEVLHLTFLRVLGRPKGPDPSHFVLKGGTNLRFFYRSVRYSEDMDFDTIRTHDWRLGEQISGILEAPALRLLLQAHGLDLTDVTAPRQTPTTQRWKMQILVTDGSLRARTKIEFSRRDVPYLDHRALEAIPAHVVERHGVVAPTVMRYLPYAALRQKIETLPDRATPQTRDVFDLELLFRQHPTAVTPGTVPAEQLSAAADTVRLLSFQNFADQTLPFIDPEVVDLYDEREWTRMCAFVTDKLEALR